MARILGYTTRTVTRLASEGRLPYIVKLDGTTGAFVFDRAAIEAHAAKRTSIGALIERAGAA